MDHDRCSTRSCAHLRPPHPTANPPLPKPPPPPWPPPTPPRHYDGYIETYRVSGRRLFWTARSRAGRTYAAELQLDEPAFYPSSFPLVVLGLANRFTRAFTFRVPRLYQDSTRERLVIDTAEGRVIGTAQVSLGNGSKVLVWVVRFDDTTYWVRKSAPEIVGWLRRLGEEERALKYVHDK